MAALLVQEDERESPLLRCQILPRRASRPVLLPSILSAPVATPKLPRPCGCGNATSSAASWYLEGGCPWTFRRRPALKMRPWHLYQIPPWRASGRRTFESAPLQGPMSGTRQKPASESGTRMEVVHGVFILFMMSITWPISFQY
ncbi:uncharacterized protein [Ovis canadensis]|uniref:uncharacterized protein isoform X2 n=1 Tax=Ovis canadensis TaxID=37174 RepID=UPI003750FCDC